MVKDNKESAIRKYSRALDSVFSSNITKDVAIRFESGDYVIYLIIRNGKAEIIAANK